MRLPGRRRTPPPTEPPPAAERWRRLPTPAVSRAQERERAGNVPEHGLTRSVWTDEDFALLGWHDSLVRGVRAATGVFGDDGADWPEDQIALDLDYITRWLPPARDGQTLTFWVAPCTLVFHGVTDWEMEVDGRYRGGFEIADVHLLERGWHVEGYGFGLLVAAAGFRQTFRRRPIQVSTQTLSLEERGGYSFDEMPADLT